MDVRLEQICPRCGKDQGDPAPECRKCGVVFAKLGAVDRPRPRARRRRGSGLFGWLLLAAVLLGGLAVLVVDAIVDRVKESASYQVAEELSTTHPTVQDRLGTDLRVTWPLSFEIELEHEARYTFTVKGSAGKGVVTSELSHVEGEWSVVDARLQVDGEEPIRLVLDAEDSSVAGSDTSGPSETTRGMTADELRASSVDSWGQAGPSEGSTGAGVATRPACPYTGPPASTLEDIDADDLRRTVRRSSGCVTLVMVWGAWCGTCRSHYPAMVQLADRYREDGLAVYSFSTDRDPETLRRFFDTLPARTGTYRVRPWQPGELTAGVAELGATYPDAVPFFALINRDGEVVFQGTSRAFARLDPAIRGLL